MTPVSPPLPLHLHACVLVCINETENKLVCALSLPLYIPDLSPKTPFRTRKFNYFLD